MSDGSAPVAFDAPAVVRPSGRGHPVFRTLRRSKLVLIGGSITVSVLVVAMFAPLMSPYDPLQIDVSRRLLGPSAAHPFGTDNVGRDIYSRVLFGARISLLVGSLVVLVAGGIGLGLGLLAGYTNRLDRVLMRVMDGLMAFPTTLLAIALMAALGAQLSNVIVALATVFTPRVARVVRAVTLGLRELDYIQAARSLGARDSRILIRHILPNCLAPVIVQSTFIFAESVLAEAALSFLGVGVPPYIPSWGTIITAGRMFMQTAPWITIFPGVAIVITVLGLNLLGDGLRDLADPRLYHGRA